jgi:hypothetical protein
LGYFYTVGTASESVQSTFPASAYSPSTGSSANFLTPGIYISSIFGYIYNNGTVSTTSVPVSITISSNSTTTPSIGSSVIIITTGGVTLIPTGINNIAFYPCYTFVVTTSGYYYATITSNSGTTNGSYTIGVRLLSIMRIG